MFLGTTMRLSLDILCQKCEEFSKLAGNSDDSNDLFFKNNDPNNKVDRANELQSQREHSKKHQEIRLMLMEVKKFADIVDYKYRSLEKPTGLSKVFDINYYSTLRNVKKARALLEETSRGLDKFSWF